MSDYGPWNFHDCKHKTYEELKKMAVRRNAWLNNKGRPIEDRIMDTAHYNFIKFNIYKLTFKFTI